MSKPPEQPRRALGRGLSSLIQSKPQPGISAPGLMTLSIHEIEPNPLQPRNVFDAERLHELGESILAHGLVQPLIVRRKGEKYELVAGERRWRAAKMVKLDRVPVVVQDYTETQMLEVSLIENIQREDLNPIEVASALHRLHTEHKVGLEQLAIRTGKNRATISNLLRLLKLPEEVQLLIAERRLSMGHARALAGLSDAEAITQLAEKAASQGLSVRQIERIVQRATEPREPRAVEKVDANVNAAIDELQRVLGTRVRIVAKSEQRGKIEIDYYSQEELQRIYTTIVE